MLIRFLLEFMFLDKDQLLAAVVIANVLITGDIVTTKTAPRMIKTTTDHVSIIYLGTINMKQLYADQITSDHAVVFSKKATFYVPCGYINHCKVTTYYQVSVYRESVSNFSKQMLLFRRIF